MERIVWKKNMECKVWSGDCGVWSVKDKVWSGEWGVWSVKDKLWSEE